MPINYLNDENTELFKQTINKLKNENIIERIWEKDYTIWKKDPKVGRKSIEICKEEPGQGFYIIKFAHQSI